MIGEEIKRHVLLALSAPFIREREDPIADLGAQILMNENETIYLYGAEEYREPTAKATEATALNAQLMRERPPIG